MRPLHAGLINRDNLSPTWLLSLVGVHIMDPRVRQSIRLMSKDLRRSFRVEEAARSAHLSPSRFAHLFKEQTGLAPAQYHKRLRLECARKHLEKTSLGLKQVMLRAGFHDESHFVRDFKKQYGLPPMRYRAKHKKHVVKSVAGSANK
jgi:AraC family transcriptional regulator of arabinose operon